MNPPGTTWGVEPAEMALDYPCDHLLGDFNADLYRGVTVHAPAAVTYRWLCQLRAAPYAYDWIDNWGRTSPRQLVPGLEDLVAGQTMMTIFELIGFEKDLHVTCRIKPRSPSRNLFGDVVVSYLVVPRGDGECRLLAKLRVRYPAGPIGWLGRLVLPMGDLVMMRRQLLNLKGLAETPRRG
jgi:hypothetical protein